jgi:hypothetical protein
MGNKQWFKGSRFLLFFFFFFDILTDINGFCANGLIFFYFFISIYLHLMIAHFDNHIMCSLMMYI